MESPVIYGRKCGKEPGKFPQAKPERRYSLPLMSNYLFTLGSGRNRIVKLLHELFGIVPSTSNISKALVLELLAAHTMALLDRPVSSRSNCAVQGECPSGYAGPYLPDVLVEYEGGYKVVVEVSAHAQVDLEQQLKSALRHMDRPEICADTGVGADAAILITKFGQNDDRTKKSYAKFAEENEEALRGRRILMLSIKEFAEIALDLGRTLDFPEMKSVPSEKMHEVYEALMEAAASGESFVEVWVRETRARTVPAEQSPDVEPPSSGPSMSP